MSNYVHAFQSLDCSEDIMDEGIVKSHHRDKMTEMMGVRNAYKKLQRKKHLKNVKICVIDNDDKPRVASLLAYTEGVHVDNISNNKKFSFSPKITQNIRSYKPDMVEELSDFDDITIVTDPTFDYTKLSEKPLILLNGFPVERIGNRAAYTTYRDESIIGGCQFVSIFV